jgi:glycerophosphoryl diester phosphodiesterase
LPSLLAVPVLRKLLERAVGQFRPSHLLWPPLNIGHRGAGGEAPENTLAAFELAARQGADGVEFDVHLSADGVPVVIHDPHLQRTTSGAGLVREHSSSALRRLDAGSWFNRRYPSRARPRYAGLKIPLLSEALARMREKNLMAFVEIKEGGATYPGIERKVLAEIDRAGAALLTTIISFDLPTLQRVRQIDPQIPLGLDVTRPVLAIPRAKSIAASSLLPHWAFASRNLIRRSHRAGFHVVVWDLDQPRWMRRKIADGVDGIVTYFPARLEAIRMSLEKP